MKGEARKEREWEKAQRKKLPVPPGGHTYTETEQRLKLKAEKKEAKAAKMVENVKNGLSPHRDSQGKSNKRKWKKVQKFLFTPMSNANPDGLKCPNCKAPMSKIKPRQDQAWKPF